MRAKPSDLRMVSFSVLALDTIWDDCGIEDDDALLDLHTQCLIDIDFEIHFDPEERGTYFLHMIVDINTEPKPMPGHQIKVMAEGHFELTSYDGQNEKAVIESGLTAVALMVGATRSAILAATTFSPMCSYTLPAIDMGSLIRAKDLQNRSKARKADKGKKSPRK